MLIGSSYMKEVRGNSSSYTAPNKIRRIRLQNNTRSIDEINQRLSKLDLVNNNTNLRITKYSTLKSTTQNDKSNMEYDDIITDKEEQEQQEKIKEKVSSIDPFIDCWDFAPEPICSFPVNIRRSGNKETKEQQD